MAQVSVLGVSSFTAQVNRAARGSTQSLKQSNAFRGTPLVVSLRGIGKRQCRYPGVSVVSRVVDTTTTSTTTTSENGNVASTVQGAEPAGLFPEVVEAEITVTRRRRLTREQRWAGFVDTISDLFLGKRVFLTLVSEDVDPATGVGKRSDSTFINNWATPRPTEDPNDPDDNVVYNANFKINVSKFGRPGAILIRNTHQSEIYLNSIALKLPSGTVHFPCHSYLASSDLDPKARVFFTNAVYMPSATPAGIKDLREQELNTLRGNGQGKREKWERIYDYDVYNDLGNIDKGKTPEEREALDRPILGGGNPLQYPRRIRTGRPMSINDPTKETRQGGGDRFGLYIPRDERFEPIKKSDFITNALRATVHSLIPQLKDRFDATPGEFDTFKDIDILYQEGLPELNTLNLRYPLPRILWRDRFAWMRDDEFARQALAGVNPVAIKCVKEFPIKSALGPEYGPQTSAITSEHIEGALDGMTAAQAVEAKRLFVVDYHDIFMPYVAKINDLKDSERKVYAPRALFFLHEDGFLRPLAIELSLPPAATPGAVASQRVFTPGKEASAVWLWQLAKLHYLTVDSGYHQLVSHWLRTHACTEPYVIATYRQLSALHPIAKLLHPHMRYTMEINASARQNLIQHNGVIETTFTPGRYAMEMCAVVYGLWQFDKEALPEDLIDRGMAERDENAPHGLRLRIEDYPYGADGLLVWENIESWIRDYVSLYYPDSDTVLGDVELQAWWNEVVTKGHGDKKDEPWWPTLDSPQNLVRILTTIIWIASGHHAAVNFGQYDYTGFMPNQPCLARKYIPERGDASFQELLKNPHKFMLETLPNQAQATQVMTVVQLLSAHSRDEEYLGYNGNHSNWTNDDRAVKAFQAFSEQMAKMDEKITARNKDLENKHRAGVGTLPYELLLQKSEKGITMRGIPNSISI